MRITNTLWTQTFNDFAKKNNAVFHLHKSPSMGYHSDYLTCSFSCLYRDKEVIIQQQGIKSNDEVALSFVVIEYEYENRANFRLSLNQRDFFDRLLPSDIVKTGTERFDKAFTIRASDRILITKVFEKKRVQELFLGNRFLLFNAQTQNRLTTIKLKSMERKLYSQNELQSLYNEFLYLIDNILQLK